MKLDLLSLISHELRTPLSSVLNALRILKEDELSAPERSKFLAMAFRNAEKLNATLSQLLDLSKIVSGRLVCRFQEMSLRQIVQAQLEEFEIEAMKLGRRIKVTGAVEELPVVLGDAPRIAQLVRSLFENALRFSPDESRIDFTIRTAVSRAMLSKGDAINIGGLARAAEFIVLELENRVDAAAAPVDAGAIFDVFSQQESVLDRAHEGVGGSLAIAAEVARQHGGKMHARVDDGKFTVWLVLPILRSEAAFLKVLESRLFALKTEIGATSLVVFKLGPSDVRAVHEGLRHALFRASDTVYGLEESNEVTVLMDDCKKVDAPKIVRRLIESLGPAAAGLLKSAKVGLANSPDDGTEPLVLLEHARTHSVPISEF